MSKSNMIQLKKFFRGENEEECVAYEAVNPGDMLEIVSHTSDAKSVKPLTGTGKPPLTMIALENKGYSGKEPGDIYESDERTRVWFPVRGEEGLANVVIPAGGSLKIGDALTSRAGGKLEKTEKISNAIAISLEAVDGVETGETNKKVAVKYT